MKLYCHILICIIFGNNTAHAMLPLHQAIKMRSETGVANLLNNPEIDINQEDRDGEPPLHVAVLHKQEAITRMLLTHPNIKIDLQDAFGCTPLHWSVLHYNKNIIRFLLAHGAQVNIQNDYGITPIFWAVLNGSNSTIRLLISRGAYINIKNNEGATLLHWAALTGAASRERQEELCRILLDKGADDTLQDNDGNTPLQLALDQNRPVIINILQKRQQARVAHKAQLAFCGVLHERIGADSKAKVLNNQYLVREILRYVVPEDFPLIKNPVSAKFCATLNLLKDMRAELTAAGLFLVGFLSWYWYQLHR